ncbi:MAG: transcription-repair coupling factor [Bacteroidetes bacterium]|nr:transcription-repair coupling factor [Bacteroidota bacterium]
MTAEELLQLYSRNAVTLELAERLGKEKMIRLALKGMTGSSRTMMAGALFGMLGRIMVVILSDKEEAAYFCNDLENLFNEQELPFHRKHILLFPSSYRRPYEVEKIDNANVLLRTEALKRLGSRSEQTIVVTYPEALSEKVINKAYLKQNTLRLKRGEIVNADFMFDLLLEYEFKQVDFVVEPGEFSVRGGIVDVYSYTNDYPYRIELFGEEVESIRTFDPATQLSIDRLDHIAIVPNMQNSKLHERREAFTEFLPEDAIVWIDDFEMASDHIEREYLKAVEAFNALTGEISHVPPAELYVTPELFNRTILRYSIIEFGKRFLLSKQNQYQFNIVPQPTFNKNFELLIKNMHDNTAQHIHNIILSDNSKQLERLQSIFYDVTANHKLKVKAEFTPVNLALHEGFIDKGLGYAFYTDHQIFERYHKYRIRDSKSGKQVLTLKELYDLKPGDYVTHVDHGIGKFDGLEKVNNSGKVQEAIRLIYKNGDLLYVSIHSLHRISKYTGKEGAIPTMDKLGSNAWNKLKQKTKQRVKDIAKDLIKLYAERKAAEGYRFMPDTYMQHELEASFIYEDTPDQVKATADVKKDMEESYPMDRLVCGDVGFGKTEIAIRAAFKAVADSKQVAILVPTTILALQHFKTFRSRLKEFPCTVDYVNRFKSAKEQKQTLERLKEGKVDILIGTHRLLSQDVQFKDLGLLIIDEEQKFGVAAKEKLKSFKTNVDSLTLTATPIPRTLQFSMMGARDLSIINTAPPNRYPVQTEVHTFSEQIIRDAILFELSRGGQVFFVNNRIQNIIQITGVIQRLLPDIRIAIGHGQMDGHKLEKIMLDFIEGEYDVLVATTIIESGLDIPNVNTIIISDAQNYGLSELHQLRGRVGRTNKKAFCYLLAPPLSVLTDEARQRLKAIEEFSDLGSGFNIAMRDLDIRGAGNILGGEQSGFISEIGFEMYNRILDEAILEIKETDFKDVFAEEIAKKYVKECQIETDLEVLLPDAYVSSTTERLSLYKELDSIENENDLMTFQEGLIDRFGPVPHEAVELMNALRLRWLARDMGLEKLVIKQSAMLGFFIQNPDSPYYQSAAFTSVLQYLQSHPTAFKMRQNNDRLHISFKNINSISTALAVLKPIVSVEKTEFK